MLQRHNICQCLLPKAQAVRGGEGFPPLLSFPYLLPSPSPSPLLPPPSPTQPFRIIFQVEMVMVPLSEEEMYRLFNNEEGSQRGKMCRCFCNCDEVEPPPRVRNTSFSLHFSPHCIKKCPRRRRRKRKSKPTQEFLTLRWTIGNQRFLLRNGDPGSPLRFRSCPESRWET